MAIKNIFGFDQFAPRVYGPTTNFPSSTLQSWLDEEGYPFLVETSYWNSDECPYIGIYEQNGRNWWGTYHWNSASTNRQYQWRLYNSISALFGAESPKTKWFFGFRISKSTSMQVAGTGGLILLMLGSEVLLYDVELANGERYIEVCLDWVAGTYTVWVDGTVFRTNPISLTTGLVLSMGRVNRIYYHLGPIYMTDFYFLVDTQDDTPCTRLGPVKVSAVLLDEAVAPADWTTFTTGAAITINGASYSNIVPVMSNNNMFGFTLSGDALTSGNFFDVTDRSASTHARYTATGAGAPTEAAPKYIQFKLPVPRRIDGYGISSWAHSQYYALGAWFVEGSEDGVVWNRLQTKARSDDLYPTGTFKYYELSPDVVKPYQYYRLGVTGPALTVGANNSMGVGDFLLLEKAPTRAIEELNDPIRGNNLNLLNTGVRTATNGSEMSVSFAPKPPSDNKILMVQVRAKAMRQTAAVDQLNSVVAIDGIPQPARTFPLTDVHKDYLLGEFYKKPNGTPFTHSDLGNMSAVIKSIPGN